MLRPSPDRRELLGPGQAPPQKIAAAIREFEAALERRSPGAAEQIAGYRPRLDEHGALVLNPRRRRPGAKTIREAEMISKSRMW